MRSSLKRCMRACAGKAGRRHELCQRNVFGAVRRHAVQPAGRAPLARAAVDFAGGSYVFYGWWDWRFCFLMFALTLTALFHGTGHGALAAAAARTVRAGRGGAAGGAGRIQVRGFLRRFLLRAVRHRTAAGAGHHPAGRHLVLHLSEPELYDRRLSRQAARLPRPDVLFAVHRLLSAAGRGTDRQGGGLPAAARGGPPPGTRRRLERAEPVRVGHVQEGRAGGSPVGVRRSGIRDAAGVRFAVRGAGGCVLRAADLLRLFQLFGHGDRLRARARLRAQAQLRPAVHRPQRQRVLAALAHQPVHMAQGIPLHSARRQPQGPRAHVRQPHADDGARRTVARRGGELRALGRAARRGAGGSQGVAARASAAARRRCDGCHNAADVRVRLPLLGCRSAPRRPRRR